LIQPAKGGKAKGGKFGAGKFSKRAPQSRSARAGLQVSAAVQFCNVSAGFVFSKMPRLLLKSAAFLAISELIFIES